MKKVKILLFIFICLFNCSTTFSQTSIITDLPHVESKSAKGAVIEKVELTDKYTIIYMSFIDESNQSNRKPNNNGKIVERILDILLGGNVNLGGMNGGQNTSTSHISIRPSSKLVTLNGQRVFKFIKASGIPVEPQQMDVRPGEKVNFKVYYERVDPGISLFDFFEGYDSDKIWCWNFYKVHITNPSPAKNEPLIKRDSTNNTVAVQPVFFIKGQVLDSKTNKPINAKLEFRLSPKMTAVDSTMTFWNTGGYKTTLPSKGIYNVIVSAQGYLVAQELITLTDENGNNTVEKNIFLTPIVKGDLIRLNNVYFEMSQYELLSASYDELDKLVTLMQENPTIKIIVEGHTDIVGDKQANIDLSKNRVISVKNYLVKKGIESSRIETKGWGSAKPLVSNGTDEERKINRRVEFRILNL